MFCISCGAKLPDDARFCAVCGAKAYRPEPEEEAPEAEASEEALESGKERSDAPEDGEGHAAPGDGQFAGADAEGTGAGRLAGVSDAPASEVALRGKVRMKVKNPALRDGSGALDLPEIQSSQPFDLPDIDTSQPFGSVQQARDGREDDISVSPDVTVVLPPGPFKPSYGPLSASDLFVEADGTTAKMPRIETADGEVLVEGDSPVKNFVQSNTVPKRWTPARVALLVVMVLVAVALAVAAVRLYGQRSQDSAVSAPAPASTSSPASTPSPSSPSQASSSSSSRSEEARLSGLYDRLDEVYAQIGTLNERMGQAVDDYNTYYAAPEQADRQQAADACNALSSDIAAAATELSAFMDENDCTEGTAYYGQFQDQLRLLDLLSQRVAPLVSSWERSVASSSPASDETYILEPLTQVDSTSLVNQFDALYAQSAPTKE